MWLSGRRVVLWRLNNTRNRDNPKIPFLEVHLTKPKPAGEREKSTSEIPVVCWWLVSRDLGYSPSWAPPLGYLPAGSPIGIP